MNYNPLFVLWAYFLDVVFGDPRWMWHPVRITGIVIAVLERKLNKKNINRIFSGALCVILTVGLTIFCVYLILETAKRINFVLYSACYVLLVYFALSVKDLAIQANKVRQALESKNIVEARKKLSLIVGRDTEGLNEQEIIRAAVETVAESAMDGIIAPLFYCFLAGPVGMWFYKAVNTLDSMIGYTNERFIEFGRVAAKLDGMMNFIPARLTAFLIGISGLLYGKNGFSAFKWGFKYFLKGPASNSQMTEAAMAGALRVRLGGVNYYNSIASPRPLIGDDYHPLEIKHIRESMRIIHLCAFLFILFGVVFSLSYGSLV